MRDAHRDDRAVSPSCHCKPLSPVARVLQEPLPSQRWRAGSLNQRSGRELPLMVPQICGPCSCWKKKGRRGRAKKPPDRRLPNRCPRHSKIFSAIGAKARRASGAERRGTWRRRCRSRHRARRVAAGTDAGGDMLGRLKDALRRRRAAMAAAEALVWAHGSQAAQAALDASLTAGLTDAERGHFVRVARIAERRHRYLESLDTAGRYAEAGRRSAGPSAFFADIVRTQNPTRETARLGSSKVLFRLGIWLRR